MPTTRPVALQILLLVCALLAAVPAFAQVPRAIYAELGSATW
jgi:hypothetical protein